MLAKRIREAAQADRGEKIDGEARVPRILAREEAREDVGHVLVVEPVPERRETQVLREFLAEDLDEDPRRRRRLLLVESYVFEARPGQRVRLQQVREELGHVPQLVCLETVDHRVLLLERLVEGLLPGLGHDAEPLPEQAVVAQVCSLLRAALDQHVA